MAGRGQGADAGTTDDEPESDAGADRKLGNRCGLSSDPVYSQELTRPMDGLTLSARDQNDLRDRVGRFDLPSAVIVPFDCSLFLTPR
jgi:hypothetical protein